MIIEHTFAPAYLTDSIRPGPVTVDDKRPALAFTLDQWEVLHGYVAAKANHCDQRKLERELDRI